MWIAATAAISYAIYAGVTLFAEIVVRFVPLPVAVVLATALMFSLAFGVTWASIRLGRATPRIWIVSALFALAAILLVGGMRASIGYLNVTAPGDPDTQMLIRETAALLAPQRLALATLIDAVELAALSLGAFFGSALANKRFQLTRHIVG